MSTRDSNALPPARSRSSRTEPTGTDLSAARVSELADLVRRAIQELARRTDHAVFAELLSLQEAIGMALGESARTLAEHGSWAQVADVAGTSRQAAWQRWRT